MLKLVNSLFAVILFILLTSCNETKIDSAEASVQVASDKACVPGAGCAGCPEAYARISTIPARELEEVLKLKPKVIFIELGSMNLLPSRKTQHTMEALRAKYDKQLQVIFYDVMKPEQKSYAEKYQIQMIPTQVFLDSDGNEITRHEGYLPIENVEKILSENGIQAKEIAAK